MQTITATQLKEAFSALNRATITAREAFDNYTANCAILAKYSFKADRMMERMRVFINTPQNQ